MTIQFLQPADFLVFITESAFQKLLRNNDSKLTDSERLAYGYIAEKLSARFRITEEIAEQGESRNLSLVRWMSCLSIYFLYQSVPDEEIPERVVKNYDDVCREVERTAAGKDNCTLLPVLDHSGKPKTAFRWSSQPRRSHNPFS